MVERVEKIVYVTEGGEEFGDYGQANKAEAIERLATMIYELRYAESMAAAMLGRHHEPLNTHFQDRHMRHVNAHRAGIAQRLKVRTDPNASHENHQRAESFICILDEETARLIIKELECD